MAGILEFTKYVEGVFNKDAFKKFSDKAEIVLNQLKDQMIEDIENHSVCKELKSKTAPSSFLQSSSSSLFGFIGFEESRDPVSELIEFLEEKIIIQKSKGTLGNRLSGTYARLYIPDKKDMVSDERLLPDFSINRSWPEMIENGFGGLDFYIQDGHGRSAEGHQSKNKVREGSFSGTPFLSEIFSKFRKSLKNL